jgi:hypothetical protein
MSLLESVAWVSLRKSVIHFMPSVLRVSPCSPLLDFSLLNWYGPYRGEDVCHDEGLLCSHLVTTTHQEEGLVWRLDLNRGTKRRRIYLDLKHPAHLNMKNP